MLPPEQKAMIKESFDSFDKNKDGMLNKNEFHEVFKVLKDGNYTPKQINLFFKSVEPNEDGAIDFNYFLELMFNGYHLSPATVAENLFKDYDKNGDGSVSFQEYMNMMEDFMDDKSPQEVQKIRDEFKKYDNDGNHKLTVAGMCH